VLYSSGPAGGTDAQLPYTGLVFDRKGNLYGTTSYGGPGQGCQAGGCGTVFELIHGNGKWTERVLRNFNSDDGDGYNPLGGLILDKAGNLDGTTEYANTGQVCSGGCGLVFELIHANGNWTEKVLHSFNPNRKGGVFPRAGVIFDNFGNLYGTTVNGGADSSGCGGYGCGAAFELSPGDNGRWTEKVLHSFYNNGRDGTSPEASLVLGKTSTAYWGGAYSNYGAVFELIPNGGKWSERVLHSFNPNSHDGLNPFASGVVLDKSVKLYGTTAGGGAHGQGSVFEVMP
jgi:uncharacterized repeat protein (TIGR03803 family)